MSPYWLMKCTLRKILLTTIKAQVHTYVCGYCSTFKCLFLIFVFMHTWKLTVFIGIGDINNHLLEYQMSINDSNSVASKPVLTNSMLVFMVRGCYQIWSTHMHNFLVLLLLGEQNLMFFSLLGCCGFKALAVTAGGFLVNRLFFKLHGEESLVYKALNMNNAYIYFISDPPHFIKTVRNCWASKKRNLWVRVWSFLKLIIMDPLLYPNPNVIREL